MSIEVGRVYMVLVREATDHGLNKSLWLGVKETIFDPGRKESHFLFSFLIDLITRSVPVCRIIHVMVFSKCSCPVIFKEQQFERMQWLVSHVWEKHMFWVGTGYD